MAKILFSGDRGFIAGYTIQLLLDQGHTVIGFDNDWKYGNIKKSYDNHPNYYHSYGDAKDENKVYCLMDQFKVDYFVMGAAIIGGISLFHTLPYFLLAENERINAASFDGALKYFREKDTSLKKIIAISSSMVYESANVFPTPEGHQLECPPPLSSYGFQKLAVEYFAKAAYDQYKLPYTIIRPFNCAGTGEYRAKMDEVVMSGNVELAMSHVIPDLIQKIAKGQYPLHILGEGNQVRHYTYAGDLARGIIECIFNPKALNDDFNLSTDEGHSVLYLAKVIWQKMNPGKEFKVTSDKPFKYDVQKRVPDTSKAKKILGFEATHSLDKILDEVIPWCQDAIKKGLI